jgi:hypothetical protein
MPSSIENTTSLGTGIGSGRVTKRQFSDVTSRSVSESIARNNYRRSVVSDSKMKRLREYVFKMVSNWPYEDKYNIIREYGDASLLKTNPSKERLNRQVTETLIINMKQEDLEILLKDIIVDESRISKEVKTIRNKRKTIKPMKESFSSRTFEKVYEDIKNVKKPKDIQKYLKAYDKSYKVPKYVTNQYGNLKKELIQVLRDIYNKVELAGLALQMEINFEDGASFKEISQMIVNKTLLYVDLIIGKSKKGYSTAILNVDPYNELLSFTSYAYVTGKTGLSSSAISDLKKSAMLAKSQVSETFKKRNREREFNLKNLPGAATGLPLRIGAAVGGIGTGVIGSILGGLKSVMGQDNIGQGITGGFRKGRSLTDPIASLGAFLQNPAAYKDRKLEGKAYARVEGRDSSMTVYDKDALSERRSFLEEIAKEDPQKLLDKAKEYNVKTRGKELKDIVKDLLVAMEKQSIRKSKLEEQKEKLLAKGRSFDPRKQAELDAINKDLKSNKGKDYSPFGTEIPYIKASSSISYKDLPPVVLPVYVVNDLLEDKKEAEAYDIRREKAISTLEDNDDADFGRIVESLSDKRFEKKKMREKDLEDYNILMDEKERLIEAQMKAMGIYEDKKKPRRRFGFGTGYEIDTDSYEKAAKDLLKFETMPDKKSTGNLKTIDLFKDSPKSDEQRRKKYAKRRMDTDTTIFKGLNQDHPFIAKFSKGTNQPFDTEGTYGIRVMDMSAIWLASKMKESRSVTPHISQPAIDAGINIVKKEPATPVYIINKDLDVTTKSDQAADELKKVALKMALNASGFGFLAPALGLAKGGRGNGPRFAKGTVSNAMNATTQFISGDSLNGKPNEEQVSIDWSKKSFEVRPIPKMDKQSLNQSGISSVSQLTSADRAKPMAVGITSHSVSYNRNLKYATDHGNKDAIKVYPVTPGLDDEIEYNGNKFSAIGLMAEMALRLSNIEGLLNVGNQQREAVIESTRATARNITKLGSAPKQGNNPFLNGGFPSSLDSILKGE